MLSKLKTLQPLKPMNNSNQDYSEQHNQRATPRRKCDQCISEIDGQNHPVEDWSMGGVKVFGDFRTYTVGQEVPVTMKFKIQENILNIEHSAQIIRKLNDAVALQFTPLTREVRTNFQKVIDDYNIREFAGSLG